MASAGGCREKEMSVGLSAKVHRSTHIFAALPLPDGTRLLSDSFFSTLLVIWAFSPMASFIVGPFKSPLKIYLEQKEMTSLLRCARTSWKTRQGNIKDGKTLIIVSRCYCVCGGKNITEQSLHLLKFIFVFDHIVTQSELWNSLKTLSLLLKSWTG